MNRDSTSAFQTKIKETRLQSFHLVKVSFDHGDFRLTDRVSTVVFDDGDGSAEWTATGHLLSISPINETAIPQISRVSIALSGVDQAYFSVFLNNDYIDREVNIWKGFLDDDGLLVVDPILIFRGRIDQPIIEKTAVSASITIEAASLWVDFERRSGRRMNSAEQQVLYPGDDGLEFVQLLVGKKITWGQHYWIWPF